MAKKKKPPEKKPILESIWQDITLFLYLWNHPNSFMNKIAEDLGRKYPTIQRALGVREKQGIVIKTKVRPIIMGEDKIAFALSEKAIEFLKNLSKKINDEFRKNLT